MADQGADSAAPAREASPLQALTRPLAIAGGFLLLASAAMVTTSVVMRWLTSRAITGDIELLQIGTALAVFTFLPLCQGQRGNIMVDTFTTRLPATAQRTLDALWDVVYAFMALMIAWRLAAGALDTIRSNTVSMMLGLPTGWAIAACAAMAALLGIVAVGTALRLWRRPA